LRDTGGTALPCPGHAGRAHPADAALARVARGLVGPFPRRATELGNTGGTALPRSGCALDALAAEAHLVHRASRRIPPGAGRAADLRHAVRAALSGARHAIPAFARVTRHTRRARGLVLPSALRTAELGNAARAALARPGDTLGACPIEAHGGARHSRHPFPARAAGLRDLVHAALRPRRALRAHAALANAHRALVAGDPDAVAVAGSGDTAHAADRARHTSRALAVAACRGALPLGDPRPVAVASLRNVSVAAHVSGRAGRAGAHSAHRGAGVRGDPLPVHVALTGDVPHAVHRARRARGTGAVAAGRGALGARDPHARRRARLRDVSGATGRPRGARAAHVGDARRAARSALVPLAVVLTRLQEARAGAARGARHTRRALAVSTDRSAALQGIPGARGGAHLRHTGGAALARSWDAGRARAAHATLPCATSRGRSPRVVRCALPITRCGHALARASHALRAHPTHAPFTGATRRLVRPGPGRAAQLRREVVAAPRARHAGRAHTTDAPGAIGSAKVRIPTAVGTADLPFVAVADDVSGHALGAHARDAALAGHTRGQVFPSSGVVAELRPARAIAAAIHAGPALRTHAADAPLPGRTRRSHRPHAGVATHLRLPIVALTLSRHARIARAGRRVAERGRGARGSVRSPTRPRRIADLRLRPRTARFARCTSEAARRGRIAQIGAHAGRARRLEARPIAAADHGLRAIAGCLVRGAGRRQAATGHAARLAQSVTRTDGADVLPSAACRVAHLTLGPTAARGAGRCAHRLPTLGRRLAELHAERLARARRAFVVPTVATRVADLSLRAKATALPHRAHGGLAQSIHAQRGSRAGLTVVVPAVPIPVADLRLPPFAAALTHGAGRRITTVCGVVAERRVQALLQDGLSLAVGAAGVECRALTPNVVCDTGVALTRASGITDVSARLARCGLTVARAARQNATRTRGGVRAAHVTLARVRCVTKLRAIAVLRRPVPTIARAAQQRRGRALDLSGVADRAVILRGVVHAAEPGAGLRGHPTPAILRALTQLRPWSRPLALELPGDRTRRTVAVRRARRRRPGHAERRTTAFSHQVPTIPSRTATLEPSAIAAPAGRRSAANGQAATIHPHAERAAICERPLRTIRIHLRALAKLGRGTLRLAYPAAGRAALENGAVAPGGPRALHLAARGHGIVVAELTLGTLHNGVPARQIEVAGLQRPLEAPELAGRITCARRAALADSVTERRRTAVLFRLPGHLIGRADLQLRAVALRGTGGRTARRLTRAGPNAFYLTSPAEGGRRTLLFGDPLPLFAAFA